MEEKPRTTPYPLRMSDALRTRLEQAAQASSRSLHAEIVTRLETSFSLVPEGVLVVSPDEIRRKMTELEHEVARMKLVLKLD